MSGSQQNVAPLMVPKTKAKLVPKQHHTGLPTPPAKRLESFSANEFEEFVEEWAFGYLSKEYKQVFRAGGAGDKGRDVIGYVGDPSSDDPVDVFQCKFYANALTPTDIWVELGKLCYYCFIGDNKVPRFYYLIALKGVGASLNSLIEKPDELKKKLIAAWPTHCEKNITKQHDVPLTGALKKYVEDFDFSILRHKTPLKLVEEHAQTKYHALRFGGLVLTPPAEVPVPSVIQSTEARYVEQLLSAYGDHKKSVISQDDLPSHPQLKKHFDRSRESFYQAESLLVLSRDASIDGCEFDNLQKDIHDAVVDVAEGDHDDGYARVKATTDKSVTVALEGHPLSESVRVRHRHGIVHQLANEDKLTWVPE